jgi:hypothetical protein
LDSGFDWLFQVDLGHSEKFSSPFLKNSNDVILITF